MKDKFKFISYTLILRIAFILSCKQETIYDGPRGELKGNVALDNLGSNYSNNSGVLVSVEGTAPHLQTTTDANGDWDIKNLTTGVYNLIFSKDSFATFKVLSWQFIGGNFPYITDPVQLIRLPYNAITEFRMDTSSYMGLNVYVTLKLAFKIETSTSFRIYISEDPKVSFSNYQSTFQGDYWNSSTYSNSIPGRVFSNLRRGISLYAICYPSNFNSNSYTDMVTGNQIYEVNAAFASQIVPFTIPITIY